LNAVYLAKGALATTAIEGNTLSEQEALQRVQGKLELPPSREYLGKEIDNIVIAANGIFERLITGEACTVTYDTILAFNKQVLEGLDFDEGVIPGSIRTYDVGIGSYHAVPHQDCEYLLRRLCDWLNDDQVFQAPPGQQIVYAIMKAVLAHLYLVWIHPFADGNGRTARLVEFQILAAADVPLPAAHLLSDHYNRTRTAYYRHLERSSMDRRGVTDFLVYAVQGFVDSLREQLDLVRGQQLIVTWRDYVHETLHGDSVTIRRRRHLVLDISTAGKPVPIHGLPEISGRVAKDYASRSSRTIVRDVRELILGGYLKRVEGGIVADIERIEAFLPARRCSFSNTQSETAAD